MPFASLPTFWSRFGATVGAGFSGFEEEIVAAFGPNHSSMTINQPWSPVTTFNVAQNTWNRFKPCIRVAKDFPTLHATQPLIRTSL